MTAEATATREIAEAEIQAALRVLQNWGGLRDKDADAPSIVKTMLMAAAKTRPCSYNNPPSWSITPAGQAALSKL